MTAPPTGSDGVPRRSPLHAEHERLGARFVDFAGWTMPVRYGSDVAEHTAVRTGAGIFDLSHMGELEVAGAQAAAALDRALVGNLSALRVGGARYSMICADDGGVIDDLVVYRLADDRFLVVANASNAGVVAAELSGRADGLDATVDDASARWALIAVQGPRSARILAEVVEGGADEVDPLRYYSWHAARGAGVDVLLARTGYTGEDGFEVFADAERAADVWRALMAAGQGHGLVPCGLAARDTLRLEAGMPLYGNELSREVTPYEAGLGRVVKLDKAGDFVGRAALAARADRPLERTLIGLTSDGRRSPRAGQDVIADGEPVGRVTSGAPSPTLGHPVAMAYVPPDLATPGTSLTVDVRGSAEPVRVVELPFYRRAR